MVSCTVLNQFLIYLKSQFGNGWSVEDRKNKRRYLTRVSFRYLSGERSEVLLDIDYDSVGWREFMISQGLIWFDRMGSGKWSIKSIKGAYQEKFENENLIGWETNKGIIPPTCFPAFGNLDKPKVDLFT